MADRERAAKQAIAAAGGPSELARQLGVTRSAVSQWRAIPLRRLREVASITGLPRERLRPDIFDEIEPERAAS